MGTPYQKSQKFQTLGVSKDRYGDIIPTGTQKELKIQARSLVDILPDFPCPVKTYIHRKLESAQTTWRCAEA